MKTIFTIANFVKLTFVGYVAVSIPGILSFIESQNKFFDEVTVFTPDLEGLEMRELQISEEVYEILDPKTGTLKQTGWINRDKGIILNSEAVKPEPANNWLKESTKVRHLTLMTTFSEKKISVYRLFDIGIN